MPLVLQTADCRLIIICPPHSPSLDDQARQWKRLHDSRGWPGGSVCCSSRLRSRQASSSYAEAISSNFLRATDYAVLHASCFSHRECGALRPNPQASSFVEKPMRNAQHAHIPPCHYRYFCTIYYIYTYIHAMRGVKTSRTSPSKP